MDIREILALNLRKLRRARGLSQEELAHRAKIDRTYVSSLERSIYAAGIDVVDRLGRALVEAEDLRRRPLPNMANERSGRRPSVENELGSDDGEALFATRAQRTASWDAATRKSPVRSGGP